jgi:hypothetical protein
MAVWENVSGSHDGGCLMAVIPLFPNPDRVRPVRRPLPTISEQLAGLRTDLAAASAETRDPLAAEELVSAARRVGQILQRMEAGQ